jgi:hypothetical protein
MLADKVPTMAFDRARLTELLESSTEEAQQRCAIQLRRGAPLKEMDFFWEEGHELAATYSGRAEHIPDNTYLPVLGIEEAMVSFREHPTDVFTMVLLDGDDGYHYVLFISVADIEVIACIASPVHS